MAAASSKRGHSASGSVGNSSNKRKGKGANRKSATGGSMSAREDPSSPAANEEHRRVQRTRPAREEEDEERKRPKGQARQIAVAVSKDDDESSSSESSASGSSGDAEGSPKGAEVGGEENSEEDDSKTGESDHDDNSDEESDREGKKGEVGDDVQKKSSPPGATASDTPQQPKPAPTNSSDGVGKMISDGRYRNKQRCLVLCSRGVTARYRHLLEDLRTLLPHHKKDSKLDSGKNQVGGGGVGRAVNDIAELKGCNTLLFLECRKRGRDAYLWMSQTGSAGGGGPGAAPGGDVGPSVRFHLTNVHTMDELKLTGNCMKGSRPVLTFDESFETVPHLRLLKGLFIDVFGTPRGHPKSKPFVDRVIGFYNADNKIWVRNYQIVEEQPTNAKEVAEAKSTGGLSTSLVEIGPRFVLDPIRIFSGSFGGQTLFRNPHFVSPNALRAERLKRKGSSYAGRKEAQKKRRERSRGLVLPEDPLDSVFR